MTRPIDPAALETLAITLHQQYGKAWNSPLDRRPSIWREISPEQRQEWRDMGLKLIAEQTPPKPEPLLKAKPNSAGLPVTNLPEGKRLMTRFELACLAVLKGLHPESTSHEPPHQMRMDEPVLVDEDTCLPRANVESALKLAKKRNIKLMSLFGSDAYIDRSGDVRK